MAQDAGEMHAATERIAQLQAELIAVKEYARSSASELKVGRCWPAALSVPPAAGHSGPGGACHVLCAMMPCAVCHDAMWRQAYLHKPEVAEPEPTAYLFSRAGSLAPLLLQPLALTWRPVVLLANHCCSHRLRASSS